MAKSDSGKGGGPGTYTQNGVRCTMDSPFGNAGKKTGGPGIDGHNKAPFEKAQSMGNGGIPTRFFDEGITGSSRAKTPAGVASQTSTPGTIMTSRSGK